MWYALDMEKGFQLKIKSVEKIVNSKETETIIECLKTLEIGATPIGEGDSSTILAAEGTLFDRVCLKKIKKQPKMICNDIKTEYEYQLEAHKAGVKTPLPLFSLETQEGDKYICMERMYGYNLAEIIEKPSLLPESFDYITFCKALKDELIKLHNAEIYHRSFHVGNIMVEKETGLPIILDFGTATKGSGSDLTYEASVLVLNKNTLKYEQKNGGFEDDDKMLEDITRRTLLPFRNPRK